MAHALAVLLMLGCAVSAGAEPTRCVLIIGIDGCRPDALARAHTPHLDRLIAEGAFDPRTRVLPKRPTKADSVSGPGWSSIFTGVWAEKHGVINNDFAPARYGEHPSVLARLHALDPTLRTAAAATWHPITDHILTGRTERVGGANDEDTTDWICRRLERGDVRAAAVHLDEVDGAGHGHGFSPDVAKYIAAIERADAQVGRIVAALARRPQAAGEQWLILVTSDHGGRGTGHSGGWLDPEVGTSFLIVSGPAARRGLIADQTYLVDVVPTALAFLGVPIDPAWKLDGRPVGLLATDDAPTTRPFNVASTGE